MLATATGITVKLADLPPDIQESVADLPQSIARVRVSLLDEMVNQRVLSIEARSQNTSVGKLVAIEKAKVAGPSEQQIKATLEANAETLSELKAEEARRRVIAYLRSDGEQKQIANLVTRLRIKYKFVKGKDVNAPTISPTDVVATVDNTGITSRQFEDFAKIALYEARADLSDAISDAIDEQLVNSMIQAEAKAQNTDASTIIAKELTNKMVDYTDEERQRLERTFISGLYSKYKAKILYQAPESPLQNVSADDDPSIGPADAPVTVIMFSDFQCPTCSATHPRLKEAIAAFPGKVRFVVRDFPLESIHDHSLDAAKAAAAANMQGKFFEYIDILYKNQDSLDPASLKKYAAQIGLNVAQFDIDFNSEKTVAEIRKDLADGEILNITGTPTIFVNGRLVHELSVDSFKSAIEKALSK